MRAIVGGARLSRAVGVAASVVVGLLVAREIAPKLGERLAKPWAPSASQVMAGWGSGFRLAQFTTYLVVLAAVAPCVVIWAALERSLAKRSPTLGHVAAAALAAGAVTACFVIARPLGFFALLALAASSSLIVGGAGPASRPRGARDSSLGAVLVLVSAVVAGIWSAWVMCVSHRISFGLPAVVGIAVAVAAFLGLLRLDRPALDRAALVASPALLLPLCGLFRAPGGGWLVAAVIAGAGIAKLAASRPELVPRAMPWLLVVAAWSIAAACIMPVGARDFLTINASSHEAQHLGWVNSAFHGRLLGADAGTFYGILREYAIVAYCWTFGVTIEHVRMAHVLLNLVGLAIVLVATKSLVPRRPLLFFFLAYLFLFYTSLRCFCDIDNLYIAFGWADILRSGGPIGVVVATAHVLERDAGRRWLRLVGCGALAALALFYSQEFGLCGVVAILATAVVFHLLRRRGLPLAGRVRGALASLAALALGIALPIGLVLSVYALFGKARLLVTTTWTTLSLVGSGAFGSLDFPISAATFDQPFELFAGFVRGLQSPKHHDSLVEFIVPLALYVLIGCYLALRLFSRRWGPRCTPLVGLLFLGITSYRMILARASIDQVMNSCAPAIPCLGVLLDESIDYGLQVGRLRLRLGLVNAALLVFVSLIATERIGALSHQLEVISKGVKVPSKTQRFVYPDLPRAGDTWVDPDSLALARFVRSTTHRQDPIFTLLYMMDGGELYFLCDRPNPTRYDLLAEIMTAEQRREVLESLKTNPPRLIIGMDGAIVGHDVISYVRKRWTVPTQVGHYTVWREP